RDWIAAGKLTVLEETSLDAVGAAYADRHQVRVAPAPSAALRKETEQAPQARQVTTLYSTADAEARAERASGADHIVQLLEEEGLMATTVIADRLGAKRDTINKALNRMKKQGLVIAPSTGLWQLAETVDDHELEPAL